MPSFNINPEDRIRLQHMFDAALEIIGEAATQVSKELRENVPSIPWQILTGMRNRLVHAYFSINLNIVWSTSVEDIPQLIEALNSILNESE